MIAKKAGDGVLALTITFFREPISVRVRVKDGPVLWERDQPPPAPGERIFVTGGRNPSLVREALLERWPELTFSIARPVVAKDVDWVAITHRKSWATPYGGREHHGPNPTVLCACGCGLTLLKFDQAGRPRTFLRGHNAKKGKGGRFIAE